MTLETKELLSKIGFSLALCLPTVGVYKLKEWFWRRSQREGELHKHAGTVGYGILSLVCAFALIPITLLALYFIWLVWFFKQ